MFDFDKMKMPKWLFMQPKKSLFKQLGLHHACITAGFILLFSFIGLGTPASIFWVGWYASREWGWDIYPPKNFEVMDFISPLAVALIYNLVF
tara:strand:- start:1547 stop:1822 length:276 start_codon:yes stop_codon:yes gene_type:complete